MFYIIAESKEYKRLTQEQQSLAEEHIQDAYNFISKYYLPGWTTSEMKALAEDVLLRVARKFNPNAGTKFTTYLHTSISREVATQSKKPYRKKELPTPISLDDPSYGVSGDEIALIDMLEDMDAFKLDDYIRFTSLNQELDDTLNDQEKRVVELLKKGHNATEIAKMLKLSNSRIHIIINKVKAKVEEIVNVA